MNVYLQPDSNNILGRFCTLSADVQIHPKEGKPTRESRSTIRYNKNAICHSDTGIGCITHAFKAVLAENKTYTLRKFP